MMDIMIVDDSQKMRAMIKKILCNQLANIDNVFECGDGDEAIQAYELNKPDWVLMDVEMKPMDGFSATAKIMQAHPNAKIVIVTQYNEPEFREVAKKAGAFAYVFKENLTDVLKIIREN